MRSFGDKIIDRDKAVEVCRAWRTQGARVGFTSGAFDLLHAGHADFLQRARAMCDRLVVGVNSDDSVRSYKGAGRPVVGQDDRAALVAALEAVDCVFLFSERRNARNISLLQPDLYIKAGDYAEGNLTSAEVAKAHGGKSVLVPIERAVSTTALIQRAAESLVEEPEATKLVDNSVSISLPSPKSAPALFVDRDGTINREIEYLHEPERFELLPNAGEGLRRFADMGYRIVVITNQAGIGLGYFSKEDFYAVNRAMFRALAPHSVRIDRIYFCPHSVTEGCACSKPGTALFERAARDLHIDMAHSVFVGDKTSDVEAGRRLGLAKILVRTGHAGSDGLFDVCPDATVDDLLEAAQWVLDRERQS